MICVFGDIDGAHATNRLACKLRVEVGRPEPRGRLDLAKCEDTRRVRALIDTGAMTSGIGSGLARELGIVTHGTESVIGIEGNELPYPVASVFLRFPVEGGRSISDAFDLLVLPGDEQIVLGMDVLRLGRLTIDGPSGVWAWTLLESSLDRLPTRAAELEAERIREALATIKREETCDLRRRGGVKQDPNT